MDTTCSEGPCGRASGPFPSALLKGGARHLRLEDEGFEEKKPSEPLMLPIVLAVLGVPSTNVIQHIVGTGIFARLFVSTNGQNRKYNRHANMGMFVCKHRRIEPRIQNTEPRLRSA